MTHSGCPGPWCGTCVEEALYAGALAPRDDEDVAVDAGLERALGEIAEEARIAAEDDRGVGVILAQADIEIERAQADGTDRYPGDDQ